MAKLEFHNELWLVKDPEWVAKREADWDKIKSRFAFGKDSNQIS